MDSRAYNTHLAFDVTLRTGAHIYFSTQPLTMTSKSTAGVSVAISPQPYIGKVTSPPDIVFTQTAATDGATPFTVTNLDYLISALIPEEDRLFDDADVNVYICFKKSDGSYEGLLYAIGRLKGIEGDHEIATISFVSDMSDKDITVGGRQLTQKCLNILGVNSGKSWCRATGTTGLTCTKVLDDKVGGCAFYGQQDVFQGVTFFNPNTILGTGFGTDTTPTGGNQGCYDVESYFRTVDGTPTGDTLKRGDRMLNHNEEIGLVESVEIIWAEYRYLIEAPSGASGIVSVSHPFLTHFEDTRGTGVLSLLATDNKPSRALIWQQENDLVGDDETQARIVEHVLGRKFLTPFKATIAPSGYVVKIGMTDPHTYLAGREIGKYLSAHNQKPVYNNNL